MKVDLLLQNVSLDSFIADYLSTFGISDMTSYINAGADELEAANSYLNIDVAAERLNTAIDNYERVGIICDCDLDGTASATIAYQFLASNGIEPTMFYHSGKQHGVHDLLDQILEAKLDLLIIPDASGSPEDCAVLKSSGCDVLIADHHELESENPYAIVVNCMQGDTNHDASGTTVMAKIVDYTSKMYNYTSSNYDDLIALSLISDSRSMLSIENRAYLNLGFGGSHDA